jgi:hypothetical protein
LSDKTIVFKDFNAEDVYTIKKIASAATCLGTTEKSVCFQAFFNSYKSMYEFANIDKKIIKSLKEKNIIINMLNSAGSGSVGIFIYFNIDCDFDKFFETRQVLFEKYKPQTRVQQLPDDVE